MSLITALLIFSSNFFVNVVIPFYLQNARGLSPSYAGLLMMVFPLMMVVGAPLSGYLTDRVGPEIFVLVGLGLLSVTQVMYMFCQWTLLCGCTLSLLPSWVPAMPCSSPQIIRWL